MGGDVQSSGTVRLEGWRWTLLVGGLRACFGRKA
jgi:hypothetical protein